MSCSSLSSWLIPLGTSDSRDYFRARNSRKMNRMSRSSVVPLLGMPVRLIGLALLIFYLSDLSVSPNAGSMLRE
jgi:hypothetical protein